MNKDKGQVENLIKRVEELLIVLNRVADDLRQISIELKSFSQSKARKESTLTRFASDEDTEIVYSTTDIKSMFTEKLLKLIKLEEKEKYIVIRPLQFLGSENFAKIAAVVRNNGGDYISAGKKSHFRLPKKRKKAMR
jgi:hypothetical protein